MTPPVDSDGDGYFDADETAAGSNPNDPKSTPVDLDGDGVPNDQDAFPNDPNESKDSDGDKVGDNADKCPNTPAGTTVGADGCPVVTPPVDDWTYGTWGKQGRDNLPCTSGSHWVLTGNGITAAEVSFDNGPWLAMSQNGRGAWALDGGVVTASMLVKYRYQGVVKHPVFTLSHCTGVVVPPPGDDDNGGGGGTTPTTPSSDGGSTTSTTPPTGGTDTGSQPGGTTPGVPTPATGSNDQSGQAPTTGSGDNTQKPVVTTGGRTGARHNNGIESVPTGLNPWAMLVAAGAAIAFGISQRRRRRAED